MFIGYSAAGEPAAPPLEYYEMVILPGRGISYSELKRMTMKERRLLFTMLDIEARAMPRPPRP